MHGLQRSNSSDLRRGQRIFNREQILEPSLIKTNLIWNDNERGPTEAGGVLVCWESSTERVHAILVQVKRERCLTGTKAISQILRKENWFRHEYPEASYKKWVVTSSHFSRQAKTEAEIGGIILIDRETLQEWLTREV